MAASIGKNLTFFIFKHASFSNTNVPLCISPIHLSLSPCFFSTKSKSLDVNPTVLDVLVHKHHFPFEFASWVATELGRVKNPEPVDSMLSFLKSSGFSNAQLQKILKCRPGILCFSLEHKIRPKIERFIEEGFSSADISKIISHSPQILQLSLNNSIIPSLSSLRGVFGSNAAVINVVRKSPRILKGNLQKTLVPNVEFLKSCGVSMDRIRIILCSGSLSAFICKPEVIGASVEKTKEMGLSVASKGFIYAIQSIASMKKEVLELKFQALRDMGFSDSDILRMFRREPRVFSVSTEKMKKITECLVATRKFDISNIVDCPKSLTFSLEKRYKPRIAILRILESRNLIENWPPLRVLLEASEAEFRQRFVLPYINEVGEGRLIKH